MRLALGAKFTLTVLVILAGTMAANMLYFVRTSSRAHEAQLAERGRALGRLVALISPEAILGFDYLLLNDYTREVALQPDVVYSVVVTHDNAPISSYIHGNDTPVKRMLNSARPEELYGTLMDLRRRSDLINLEFPIVHDGTELGRFLIGLSRESLQAELRRQIMLQALIVACIVGFLSTAIYAVFRFNVLYPIRRLIAASKDVGRGQYTPVPVDSADELGMLTRAFNAMAEEVKQEQEKLHRQANYDTLTGLPNRMMAFDRLNQEIRRARRSGQRFAVYFIDLDDFKHVNDSLGHAAGDKLLASIGIRLQAALRDTDTVARLGGDEFLVLLPNVTDEVQVEKVAERLLQAVAGPHEVAGRRLPARCSVGIALYPDNGDTVEKLMINADEAMYQAKATQHGSAVFFTDEMNVRLRERMGLEQDLEHAGELGQFALHFQPILHAAGQAPYGAEVLLRWQHPQRGLVSPADFIPLAETSGQILRIGDWVLEQACRKWAAWRREGLAPGVLLVNVSRVQFRKRFSARLAELMAAHGLPPEALGLEITESVLLDDAAQVADEMRALRAMGVKLSLDDFGTGYSSLGYLKRFRFDVLKIDRSFVAGLPHNADDVSLVKAIVAIARGLDLQVVAEGVETEAQLECVRALRCDFVQGHYLSRPLDEQAYRQHLESLQGVQVQT